MDSLPASLRPRAARVRSLVFELCPRCAERVTWDAISFYDPTQGGPIKGSICQIVHRGDALRLDFPLGYLIDDPEGLLSEEKGRKGKRFIALSARTPAIATLKQLILASAMAPPKPKRI